MKTIKQYLKDHSEKELIKIFGFIISENLILNEPMDDIAIQEVILEALKEFGIEIGEEDRLAYARSWKRKVLEKFGNPLITHAFNLYEEVIKQIKEKK